MTRTRYGPAPRPRPATRRPPGPTPATDPLTGPAAVLALQRSAGNRAVTALLRRPTAGPARLAVQRAEGTLAVPPAATVTPRPDRHIQIARRGTGAADVLTVLQDTPVYAVADSAKATRRKLPGGYSMPMMRKFYGADTQAGTAHQDEVAKAVGNWMEPVIPGAYHPMYAISPSNLHGPPQGPPLVDFPPPAHPDAQPNMLAIPASACVLSTLDDLLPQPQYDWRPELGPLFGQHGPRLEDLGQGELADCGFLAALGSLMVHDPAFPSRIMASPAPGQPVVVRLFDIELARTGKRFTERYVEVDRTSVYDTMTGKAAFAQHALWVKIMEKAYVAAGYLATSKAVTDYYSFANLESVNLDVALGHLAGKVSETHQLRLLSKVAPAQGPGQPSYPPRGGPYTAEEYGTYRRIHAALGKKRAVVVETVTEITKRPASARGHSSGEPVWQGLVGKHAYTVIRAERLADGRRMVRLRNPWGFYGVDYQMINGTLKRREDVVYPPGTPPAPSPPDFDVDIRDLMRRFDKVTITDDPVI